MDSASHWVLVSLAAACCLLVLHYATFSSAYQFFERYFAPIKLLVLIVLSLLLARLIARMRPGPAPAMAACAAAALFVGSNLYWTWRDFDPPFRGYIGETAYAIVRSPYASNGAQLGLAESGRIGFLYPDRVVNLDGKMRVDALHACATAASRASCIQQGSTSSCCAASTCASSTRWRRAGATATSRSRTSAIFPSSQNARRASPLPLSRPSSASAAQALAARCARKSNLRLI